MGQMNICIIIMKKKKLIDDIREQYIDICCISKIIYMQKYNIKKAKGQFSVSEFQ